MIRLTALACSLGALAGAYALWVRPSMLRWGATDEEVRGSFPGEDIIPGGRRGATMAITIDAPPGRVWPWLVQMGCDRAGWYSWDGLDNGGQPSARRLVREWQKTAVGDRMASRPNGRNWFEVAALEPERFLALRACFALPSGGQYDSKLPRPKSFLDTLWAFQLRELPGARTRLVVSGYAAARPLAMVKLGNLLFWEPAHFVMQTRQLENLKTRAESLPVDAPPSGAFTSA